MDSPVPLMIPQVPNQPYYLEVTEQCRTRAMECTTCWETSKSRKKPKQIFGSAQLESKEARTLDMGIKVVMTPSHLDPDIRNMASGSLIVSHRSDEV